jgi:RES domain-containing protein
MRVHRLSPKVHVRTAFTGDGGRFTAGRWNHRGHLVVYCSESRALAALEFFVNLDPSVAPADLAFIAADVPDELVTDFKREDLPSNWLDYPAPDSLREIGTEWLTRKSSAALRVPSAVIPEEHNILLNPRHADFGLIQIGTPAKFRFDPRMWKHTP